MGSYEMVNLLPRCDKNDHFIGSNSLVVYCSMGDSGVFGLEEGVLLPA